MIQNLAAESKLISDTESNDVPEMPVVVENYPLSDNIISNLSWLIPFAKNFWRQGNHDRLCFGQFNYEYNK